MRKVKSVASLDAQEIAVDPTLVTVVTADDLRAGFAPAHAQRGLASIPAVGADRAHVVHLPRTRLVAIGARGERADRTDVDAHTALFAVEMVVLIGRTDIRSNDGTDAAILHAESPNVHAFAADAHAAVAQDAARAVEIHHWRPLLFFLVVLGLHEFRLGGARGG